MKRLYIIENNGRGERIRTSDPLVPNQVLYQAEPLPDVLVSPNNSSFYAGTADGANEHALRQIQVP